MRLLLLSALALLIAPVASAQWTYDSDFPADASILTPHNHGLAVTPDDNVWIMAYYPFTGDSVAVDPAIVTNSSTNNCNASTNNCRTSALYVLQPDGTPASFSPLSTVTLPGGEADTLGGGTILNDSGQRVWDWNSGRGITVGPDGNIYAAYFNTVYKINYQDGTIMDVLEPTRLDTRGIAGPSVDAAGNLYATGVFPGDPIAVYTPTLDYSGNVADVSRAFNRTLFVFPELNDGAAVMAIAPNYSAKVATVYERDDEFDTTWDSTGIAFEGMAVESMAVHPTSGHVWASAGSPNDLPTGSWDDGNGNTGSYQPHTWYEFRIADALSTPMPAPIDSIKWENPGDGRPRAIAFSNDGRTAYVGEFNIASPAVQKFVRTGVSVVGGPEIEGVTLHANRPNPFSGSTEIRFELDTPMSVRLAVYDVLGREVEMLREGDQAAGPHSVTFGASGLAAGVYTVALEAAGQVITRRMMVTR